MTTSSVTTSAAFDSTTIVRWINRGLELLWLAAAVLVPLAFVDRDYMISEAVIGYVEVPKIMLLRTVAGLMAILWLVEWALTSKVSLESLAAAGRPLYSPRCWLPRLRDWLRVDPTRWLLLAVGFFLSTTLLSTILSGSFDVSLWGEVPGQDGYATYTVLSYLVVFGVVATHLRTPVQLWRLSGALILMGVLVGGYAIFQHYGNDFLGLTETTGGGSLRVTSFMGNAIFSAAVILMTIPVTLAAAVIFFPEPLHEVGALRKQIVQHFQRVAVVGIWGCVLSVQLLGLTYTFSRGPWMGTVFALAVALVLVNLLVGRRAVGRAALVLGLAFAFALAIIQSQGSLSTPDLGTWFSVVIGLGALGGAAFVMVNWRSLGTAVLALGVVGAVVIGILLLPTALRDDNQADSAVDASENVSTAADVAGRISTIKGDVLGGLLGGRTTHWRISWELIKGHPWFEFDDLSLRWLRPVVGYGPDLFRYTYLLRSPPEGTNLLPLEPDHAHNFFIHQTVEQGYLGFLSSAGLFVAVFFAGGYVLLRKRSEYSEIHKLVLIALFAVVAGRFLEMMVGVARVSDLTVLWVLLGVFAALPAVMKTRQTLVEETPVPQRDAQVTPTPRRSRSRRTARPKNASYDWKLFWRLALAAWLVGGIAILTWDRSINYARAAISVGVGVSDFKQGNLQSTLESIDRAIDLAPDVSVYHNNRAAVFVAFQRNQETVTELGCASQQQLPYAVCLAASSLGSNLESVDQRPYYYRSNVALANSAYNLPELADETVEFYRRSSALVPSGWPVLNELADAYLEAGNPIGALETLERSLAITEDRRLSDRGFFLQGRAHVALEQIQDAANSMARSLEVGLTGPARGEANRVIGQARIASGVFDMAVEHLTRAIDADSEDVLALALRGKVLSDLGRNIEASEDFERTLSIDPEYPVDHASLGRSYAKLGQYALAVQSLDKAVEADPDDLRALAFRGQALSELGLRESAFNDLNEVVRLNPEDNEAYYLRGLSNANFGQHEDAIADFDTAIRLDSNVADQFWARGDSRSDLHQIDAAVADYTTAIHITAAAQQVVTPDFEALDDTVKSNPNDSIAWNDRGLARHAAGQYELAAQDFERAVELDPQDARYLVNRGLAYHGLGQFERAIDDYDVAIAMRQGFFYSGESHYFAFFYNRGLANFQLGEYHSAASDFHRSQGDYKTLDLVEGAVAQGVALAEAGMSEEAAELLSANIAAVDNLSLGLRLDPDIVNVYYTRGLANYLLGRHDRAIGYLDEAIRLDTEDPLLYRARALVYVGLGQLGEAQANHSEALRLDRNFSLIYSLDVTGNGVATGSFTTGYNDGHENEALYDDTAGVGGDPNGLNEQSHSSYDFRAGNDKSIRRIFIRSGPNESIDNLSTWKLEYSDDATVWTEVGEFEMITGHSQEQFRDFPYAGLHRYWRIHWKSGGTGGNLWITEVEMYEGDYPLGFSRVNYDG